MPKGLTTYKFELRGYIAGAYTIFFITIYIFLSLVILTFHAHIRLKWFLIDSSTFFYVYYRPNNYPLSYIILCIYAFVYI